MGDVVGYRSYGCYVSRGKQCRRYARFSLFLVSKQGVAVGSWWFVRRGLCGRVACIRSLPPSAPRRSRRPSSRASHPPSSGRALNDLHGGTHMAEHIRTRSAKDGGGLPPGVGSRARPPARRRGMPALGCLWACPKFPRSGYDSHVRGRAQLFQPALPLVLLHELTRGGHVFAPVPPSLHQDKRSDERIGLAGAHTRIERHHAAAARIVCHERAREMPAPRSSPGRRPDLALIPAVDAALIGRRRPCRSRRAAASDGGAQHEGSYRCSHRRFISVARRRMASRSARRSERTHTAEVSLS